MGHSKAVPRGKFALSQETSKISNKQSNFTLKETRKRTTNKAQSEERKGIIRIRAEINETQSKKIQKINETKG